MVWEQRLEKGGEGRGEGAHRLHMNVVLAKEAGSGTGLVQRLDVVPSLLGANLR